MPSQVNVLLTGATGYIGGSVLARLLRHPDFASFIITAFLRSQEKSEKLRALGINTVVGSYSDLELLEASAANADVVFEIASADDLPPIKAILRGLKKRHATTGTVPVLIHTSGTGVLTDDAVGDKTSEIIYDDMDPEQIETLPVTQIHRNVDLEIVNADKEGYVKTYIILPPVIYGLATGVLVDQGIQNPQSIMIPILIRAALLRGRAGMVGQGKNIWPNAHVDDVADLYIVLYDAIRKGASLGHGREGYYFCEAAEHTSYEVSEALGEALVALGKSDNPTPTAFTKEELLKFFGGATYLGTNSRSRANRSRAIGWKPVKSKKDFLASVKPEVDIIAKFSNHEEYFARLIELFTQAASQAQAA